MKSKLENKDTCTTFSTKLEDMQVSRKLDPTAVSIIGNIISECKNREEMWLSNKRISPQTAFVLYHAARNTRIVFERMQCKFAHALELHENPKVVDEASIVFPELSEMCILIDSLEKKEITSEMLEFVRRRVRNLRTTAQKVSMLPSIEEETKVISKKALKKEFQDLAESLRSNLV